MTKLLTKFLLIPLLIINPLLCYSADSHNAIELNNQKFAKVKNSLNEFLSSNPGLKESFIGVKVKDLKTKEDVFTFNQDKLFIPASNTKIFTTLLALEKLGKDYVFKTTVTTDGQIENANRKKIINGNVYFNFSGDPTFTYHHLSDLVEQLKQQGITEIKGDIILNRNIFDNIVYGPGWMWDDMDSCDSSPIDPVFMDDNCVKVNVSVKNNKPFIETKSPLKIDFSEIQVANEDTDAVKVKSLSTDNILTLTGKIGVNNTAEVEQSIYKPEIYLGNILRTLLNFAAKPGLILENQENSILFKGEIRVVQPDARGNTLLAQNISQPVKEILKRFDKESHNLTGELLLKTVGLQEDGIRGSTKKGTDALKKYLEHTFMTTNFNFVDGSGLSRYNLASPALIVSLLEYIYNNKNLQDVVLAAFPVGGTEGTLKGRLKNIHNYKVIAKSGSMTGVNCLSGYLIGNNGNVFGFSIMINNSNQPGKILRDIQDKILDLVIK